MIQFDFNYKEWRTLKEKLQQVPEEILDLTSQGAVKHSKDYLNSQIDWNRNRLVSSIKPNKINESRVEIHATGKPATYEKYVHDGRGSFSAKNKLALHWIDKSGKDIFIRKPKKVASFKGYYHYKVAESRTGTSLNKYVAEAIRNIGV